MCLLFIPIVWFTFRCNFIHIVQLFQELYWVLTQVSHYTPRYVSLSRHSLLKAILKYKNHPSIIIKSFSRVVQGTDSFARILKGNADYFAEYICLQINEAFTVRSFQIRTFSGRNFPVVGLNTRKYRPKM